MKSQIDRQLKLMLAGDFDTALSIFEKDSHANESYELLFNTGWLYIRNGDIKQGCRLLEYGRPLNVYGASKLNTLKPIWDGSNLSNKTIIINLEGSYADKIASARYATLIQRQNGICIISCEKPLHGVIKQIKGVSKCIAPEEVSDVEHDFWIPGLSCSLLFDYIPSDVYVNADLNYTSIWANILSMDADYLNIGVSVGSSGVYPLEYPHKNFIDSLFSSVNIEKIKAHYLTLTSSDLINVPDNFINLEHFILSWDDVFASLSQLDLLITSCSITAAVAGALGKPAWLITPHLSDYIWASKDNKSPWFNTVKIYRLDKDYNFSATLDLIKSDLTSLVESKYKK